MCIYYTYLETAALIPRIGEFLSRVFCTKSEGMSIFESCFDVCWTQIKKILKYCLIFISTGILDNGPARPIAVRQLDWTKFPIIIKGNPHRSSVNA